MASIPVTPGVRSGAVSLMRVGIFTDSPESPAAAASKLSLTTSVTSPTPSALKATRASAVAPASSPHA